MKVYVAMALGFLFFFSHSVVGQVIRGNIVVLSDTNSEYCPLLTNVPARLTNAVDVAVGYCHAVALTSDNRAVRWGSVTEPDLIGIAAVAASYNSALALHTNGTVTAWGAAPMHPPVDLTNAIAIVQAPYFAMALTTEGKVVVWGGSSFTNVPSGVSNVIAIAGGERCLAVESDGTVVTWPGIDSELPVNLTNVVSVAGSGGGSGFNALLANGTVRQWGSFYIPDPPANLSNVVAVGNGMYMNLAVKSDGTLVCWGLTLPVETLPFVSAVGAFGFDVVAVVNTNEALTFPQIVFNPKGRAVVLGDSVTLSVTAIGFGLSYQWYFNQTNAISGATSRHLNLTNIQWGQAGSYSVAVSNSAGEVTSAPAVIQIAPSLQLQTASVVTLSGEVGATYKLQYVDTGNPDEWITLATVVLTNSAQLYIDFAAIGQPKRSYRLIQ